MVHLVVNSCDLQLITVTRLSPRPRCNKCILTPALCWVACLLDRRSTCLAQRHILQRRKAAAQAPSNAEGRDHWLAVGRAWSPCAEDVRQRHALVHRGGDSGGNGDLVRLGLLQPAGFLVLLHLVCLDLVELDVLAVARVGFEVVVGGQGLDDTKAEVLVAAGGALVEGCGADGTAELRGGAIGVGGPDLGGAGVRVREVCV